MGPLQKIIIVAMTIMLFILAYFTYVNTKKTMNSANFPPIISNCPDYWSEDRTGKCVDGGGLQPPNADTTKTECHDTQDLSLPKYMGKTGLCEKRKWAEACKISWDGITNNRSICK